MKSLTRKNKIFCIFIFLFFCCAFFASCAELEKKEPQSFYAETAPPPKKEFRWSNGKMPKSFDPALASAPPETDVVRAIYEGLTDTNPKTLETISAVAIDWASTDDHKVWTFRLRPDAEWSNGEKITANDFVRSWLRLKKLGDKVAHYKILHNIIGMKSALNNSSSDKDGNNLDLFSKKTLSQDFSQVFKKSNSNTNSAQTIKENLSNSSDQNFSNIKTDAESKSSSEPKNADKNQVPEEQFGAEAVDDYTLRVSLLKPDKDFPALVANPIFRPIYGEGKEFENDKLNGDIVTNGAFRIFSIGQDGLTLDRAERYWNRNEVELERVRFVPTENAEKALEAYRNGSVDAVTNAQFEPLALKLLTPFEDFERTTHSALNFYEFNKYNLPFQDRRVREALAISIERERLTDDDLDGASRPAYSFSPFDEKTKLKLTEDNDKAKNLLSEAGFPNGENFPTIKLLVNRNNIQQRIARSVARMWKKNLNVETQITVKESSEVETLKNTPEFDLIRRGVVLPTTDEMVNMMTIFSSDINSENLSLNESDIVNENQPVENLKKENKLLDPNKSSTIQERLNGEKSALQTQGNFADKQILTELEALYDFPAIPLYFPTSYLLVKPYVMGFATNNLDAPSLKDVRIDNNWQPKKSAGKL